MDFLLILFLLVSWQEERTWLKLGNLVSCTFPLHALVTLAKIHSKYVCFYLTLYPSTCGFTLSKWVCSLHAFGHPVFMALSLKLNGQLLNESVLPQSVLVFPMFCQLMLNLYLPHDIVSWWCMWSIGLIRSLIRLGLGKANLRLVFY